ncbi:MAG: cation diffusion facilitator family transporter [Chloroflexi bacterium]|nr:MAG: cation diffusion facilitator family transporter [Chloroflexota bacterium]
MSTATQDAGSESRTAVLAAMGANFAIAAAKLVAGLVTGSSAMLAEAGHSLADTVNQVFLLIGINLSDTVPDEEHPHGYGKEAFFWSFLAAIFIFVAGAVFSFYEGIRTAIQESAHDRNAAELAVAFSVLGFAAAFESASFFVACRSLLAGARRKGWPLVRYIRRSPDLTTKTVLFEDSAALTGLAVAALGLTMAEVTGSEAWDSAASIAIGCVLTAVALMLGVQSRHLLLGAAAGPEARQLLHETVSSFPEVDHIVRLLSMQLGSRSLLVTGELELRRGLTTDEIEDLIERIDARIAVELPEVVDTFWELRRRPKPSSPEAGVGQKEPIDRPFQ